MLPRRALGQLAPALSIVAAVALTGTVMLAQLLLPERMHALITLPVGALLLIGSGFAVRAYGAARAELGAGREAHERIEEELVRSEERFRLAQGLASVGTWDIDDVQGGHSTWSGGLRDLYGISSDAPAGLEQFLALVHPDDRERIRAALAAVYERGGSFEYEYRLVRPDGALRWFLSRGSAMGGDAGKPTRVLGVAMDITDRKNFEADRESLEHQLRQAQKLEAVGRLAGGIAHDFNNLLLAIGGYSELAKKSLAQGGKPTEQIDGIEAAAGRATLLTRQLLAFSRQQVLRPETLDLNEVAGEIESLLRRLIGEDVELDAVLGSAPVWVDADRGQLDQVIVNLAVNARDAMPDGGRLVLKVGSTQLGAEHGLPPGRFAVLSVTDTGSGMDAETAARIFEPFFTTKPDGTGLGLAGAYGIVKQSGGTIWVYSEVGHGSTFKVYLPLAEHAASAVTVVPAVAPAREGDGETILLVEDDLHVRAIVAEMLESRNYRVLAAADGEEAISLAEAQGAEIDLLLSDVVMPGLGGRELADRIRALQPSVCVLHMSGYTDDIVIRRGVLDHSAAFIEKPFSSDELARRIRQLLDEPALAQAA